MAVKVLAPLPLRGKAGSTTGADSAAGGTKTNQGASSESEDSRGLVGEYSKSDPPPIGGGGGVPASEAGIVEGAFEPSEPGSGGASDLRLSSELDWLQSTNAIPARRANFEANTDRSRLAHQGRQNSRGLRPGR